MTLPSNIGTACCDMGVTQHGVLTALGPTHQPARLAWAEKNDFRTQWIDERTSYHHDHHTAFGELFKNYHIKMARAWLKVFGLRHPNPWGTRHEQSSCDESYV